VQARRLVKAASGAADDGTGSPDQATELEQAARGFLSFWSEHTVRHFREEEEVLLPTFARYGDPSLEPVVRVLVEHVKIRRLADDLYRQVEQGVTSIETMRAIGELLRGHIRYEEDVLFPLIETLIPDEALSELSRRLAALGNRQ
jgi:hemerythrin-like domain-containing protein